jgi:hypothetical protein
VAFQEKMKKKIMMHIAPHHDDIFLGYYPAIKNQLKNYKHYFIYLTSGINSVSNKYLLKCFNFILKNKPEIKNNYALLSKKHSALDLFLEGFKTNDKFKIKLSKAYNIIHSINNHSSSSSLTEIFNVILELKKNLYSNNNNLIKITKKSIREFETESLWYYTNIPVKNIFHLNLPFYYTGKITEKDKYNLLSKIEYIQPDIITTISDPKNTGPNNHYKSLLLLQKTLMNYDKNYSLLHYKNVWSFFNIEETTNQYQVRKSDMNLMSKLFSACFESQKNAVYPSNLFKGNFAEITTKIWRNNFKEYKNKLDIKNNTTGLIFLKML